MIGGGAGGATAARYLAKDSKGALDVVLIEPTRTYYTCFFSNLYVGGFRDFASIGHTYGKLASDYGVTVIHDWAAGIDMDYKTIALASGSKVTYDRLIVAPGIDFRYDTTPGYGAESTGRMPHRGKVARRPNYSKRRSMGCAKVGPSSWSRHRIPIVVLQGRMSAFQWLLTP